MYLLIHLLPLCGNNSLCVLTRNAYTRSEYSDLSLILMKSERYGSKLSLEELNHFDVMKDDYQINWHLNNLRSIINPTKEETKSRSAKIKNRRLAYMDELMLDGHYFSEDAMREREPYLHHELSESFRIQVGGAWPGLVNGGLRHL